MVFKIALILSFITATAGYFVATSWTPLEVLAGIAGLAALWGPLAAASYLVLRDNVPDPLIRLTLSLVVSYTATTALYFAASLLEAPLAFYAVQAALAVGSAIVAARRWKGRPIRVLVPDVNWPLAALIAASLLVTARYSVPFEPDGGGRRYRLFNEHTLHASMSHELARHTPPRQRASMAGTPERAYHLFPHLTNTLAGRFCGQTDLLRAWIVIHYAAITVLLCLSIFCIVRTMTGSSGAGYLGAAALFVLALPFPPLVENRLGYLYFTVHPFFTSGLEPVLVTGPQMYCGLVPAFGLLLVAALVSRRAATGERPTLLLFLGGLLVGLLARFRIQVFLVALPAFIVVVAWYSRRARGALPGLGAILLAMAVGAALLLETTSSTYLPGSAGLRVGYNGLSEPHDYLFVQFLGSWPFAEDILGGWRWILGDGQAARWTCHAINMTAFTVFNCLGPVMVLLYAAYHLDRRAWRETGMVTWLCALMVAGSLAGAVLLTSDTDRYSTSAQLLLHTCWYAFPPVVVTVHRFWVRLRERFRLAWPGLRWAGAAAVAGGVAFHLLRGPTALEAEQLALGPTLSANDIAALEYIRDHTPEDAIVISNGHLEPRFAIFGGLAGRAAFAEFYDPPVTGERVKLVEDLWNTTDPQRFQRVLASTNAAILVEYGTTPLEIDGECCLEKLWSAGEGRDRVTVWRVGGGSR